MKWHRGLALAFVAFSTVYCSLGVWLSTGHGPAKTALEDLRRYDSALRHNRPVRAAALGEETIALARADARWAPAEIADLSADVARTELAANRPTKALELSRGASAALAQVAPADAGLSRLIDVARTRTDVALAAGDGLDASCTLGVLLEEVGPERLAEPEASVHPHPELLYLSQYLSDTGAKLAAPTAAIARPAAQVPLTSCELLADFYTAHKDYASAAKVSDIVIAAAKADPSLAPEMHAALLQRDAHIHELQGDVPSAQARLEDAVNVLDPAKNSQARLFALESLGTFLSNWGESARALPILQQALAIRDADTVRNLPHLAPTLVALGYAQLDGNDASAAESSFRRALSVAQSRDGASPSASIDALNALAELYDSQGRHDDAAKYKQDALKLAQTGVTDTNRLRSTGNIVRSNDTGVRSLMVELPFRANGAPASGRAQDAFAAPSAATAFGTTEVAVTAPVEAAWPALWDAARLERVNSAFLQGRVGAPVIADQDPLKAANLLFIPGEGSSFADAAARAAHLQAVAGPDMNTALAFWSTGISERGLLDNPQTEGFARAGIAATVSDFGANAYGRLRFVAEGRGALLLALALKSDAALAKRLHARAGSIALVAPELSAAQFKEFAAAFDPKTTRITVYGAQGARALVAARDVYRTAPIGLAATAPAAITGAEWIEISAGDPWADWNALGSDALFADIASVAYGGPDVSARCGIAHVSETRAGDGFVLNPHGCQTKTAARP